MNNMLKISTLVLATTLAASFATCTFAATDTTKPLTKKQKVALIKKNPQKAKKIIIAKKHPKKTKAKVAIAKKKLGNKQ